MKINKEQLELLKEVEAMLNPSDFVNAVYIPPATGLRMAADKLEKEDALKKDFSNLIKELSGEPIDTSTVYTNIPKGNFTGGTGATIN